jgi:hypothetical protein
MQSIDEFVHSQNVENLRKQLNADLDQDKRRVLLVLLAEEEGKLAQQQDKRVAVRSGSLRKTEGGGGAQRALEFRS